eukprot:scaffold17865_cov19-Tisochrysis_lutea.AAC.1
MSTASDDQKSLLGRHESRCFQMYERCVVVGHHSCIFKGQLIPRVSAAGLHELLISSFPKSRVRDEGELAWMKSFFQDFKVFHIMPSRSNSPASRPTSPSPEDAAAREHVKKMWAAARAALVECSTEDRDTHLQ